MFLGSAFGEELIHPWMASIGCSCSGCSSGGGVFHDVACAPMQDIVAGELLWFRGSESKSTLACIQHASKNEPLPSGTYQSCASCALGSFGRFHIHGIHHDRTTSGVRTSVSQVSSASFSVSK